MGASGRTCPRSAWRPAAGAAGCPPPRWGVLGSCNAASRGRHQYNPMPGLDTFGPWHGCARYFGIVPRRKGNGFRPL
eukprot:3717854-Pyramimonas_sp.AAC.1